MEAISLLEGFANAGFAIVPWLWEMVWDKEGIEKMVREMDHGYAMRLLGLAGGYEKLMPVLQGLARNYGVDIDPIMPYLQAASKDWRKIPQPGKGKLGSKKIKH